MEWLRDLVSLLPLEYISEKLSELTIWWSHFVADVPADQLPMNAYVGFSIIVLILWLFIVRVLPSPIGGISWLAVFSILLTPGSAAGDSGEIAPASIAVVYGILMKEPGFALRNLLPILVVFTVGLILGFIWQLIKNAIESNYDKNQQEPVLSSVSSTTVAEYKKAKSKLINESDNADNYLDKNVNNKLNNNLNAHKPVNNLGSNTSLSTLHHEDSEKNSHSNNDGFINDKFDTQTAQLNYIELVKGRDENT